MPLRGNSHGGRRIYTRTKGGDVMGWLSKLFRTDTRTHEEKCIDAAVEYALERHHIPGGIAPEVILRKTAEQSAAHNSTDGQFRESLARVRKTKRV